MATKDGQDQETLHIVMFPWLAFGHLIPFLELSKSLAQKGHHISFITTPRNIQRLPKIPTNLSSNFTFVSIPLSQIPNLPTEAEATIDLPVDKVPYLKQAYDVLVDGPLSNFLQTSNPDWIIHDFAPYKLPPIASKLGIPCAFFSIFTASFNAFFGPPSKALYMRSSAEQFTSPPEWIPFPSNLAFRPYEMIRLSGNIEQNASGVTDVFRMAYTIKDCDIVAIRSCMEVESEWFNLLENDIFQKPVIPIGLLPPSDHEETIDNKNEEWVKMKEWLDKQEPKSVVYVALGTEATLSQDELTELALGLELSDFPFFWVVRKPIGIESTQDDLLPNGFKERTKERGYLCMSWAPQLKILAHPSIGCCLTHCGWSSVIEALGFGCPLVLLPFVHDQAINARMFVSKNMGMEIERDEDNGSFKRESVGKSVRLVMVEEEGEMYRTKAKEMKVVFGDKYLHDKYVEDFSKLLIEQKKKTTTIK